MIVTTRIKIDLQHPSYPAVINAVQSDQNTRRVELSLYSGSVAWMVPSNVAVAVRYCKPDKTKGYYDTMPDGSAAFTVSENKVSVLLAPQILTVAGTVTAQVVLHQGPHNISTFSVQIRVEADPSAGSVTSEDYINWAQWLKSEMDAYLEQLKTSGEFVGGTFVGDVNLNGYALSGLREPVAPDDAATKEYVDEKVGTGAVSTVAGVAPDESGNVPLDAASVKAMPIGGGTMEGPINMDGQSLSGLNAPTKDDEAATKGFVTEAVKDKVDKSKVVNNFTTTEEGYVADARALKMLNDSKLSAVESEDHPGCYYRTVDGVTEWLNPPMMPGVEYRTTERREGNVVYRKLVKYTPGDINSTNTTTNIAVPHGIANFGNAVGCAATADNYTFPISNTDRWTGVTSVDATNITLRIVNDTWGSRIWLFNLAYTKTA